MLFSSLLCGVFVYYIFEFCTLTAKHLVASVGAMAEKKPVEQVTVENPALKNYINIKSFRRFDDNEEPSIEDLFNYLENPPAPCSKMAKLGGRFIRGFHATKVKDGDKIICESPGENIPRNNCIIYSLGSYADYSFEKAAYKRYGCKIYIFDPAPVPVNIPIQTQPGHEIDYDQCYVDSTDGIDKKSGVIRKSLPSIAAQLSHSNKTVNILKMDIEGDEWKILESLLNSNKFLHQVDHICMEIHLKMGQVEENAQILAALEKNGFFMFSSRRNAAVPEKYIPVLNVHQPILYELSFYRIKAFS